MGFVERLEGAIGRCGTPLVVGIDPHTERMPLPLCGLDTEAALTRFGCGVVDAVAGVVPMVKPQVAFFEQHGVAGVAALEAVVAHARERGLMVLLDAKRGDIGSTARAYARAAFDVLQVDALTLSPYLGPESLEPFVERAADGVGLFVLVRTSNPGAGAWQVDIAPRVSDWVSRTNKRLGTPAVGAVVGATLPGAPLRERMTDAWFLAPGIGAQGAGPENLDGHRRADGRGVLPVSARGVLFGAQPREGDGWVEGIRVRASKLAARLPAGY